MKISWPDLPAEPWRNGGGVTRTVAHGAIGGELCWRISVAEVEQDGPFSRFPGFERTAVLMAGRGLSLYSSTEHHRFDSIGAASQFDGEEEWHARLGAGPARLWNIIVARGRFESRVQVTAGTHGAIAPAEIRALLILGGDVTLTSGKRTVAHVSRNQVLLPAGDLGELALVAGSRAAHWALATIDRRRAH